MSVTEVQSKFRFTVASKLFSGFIVLTLMVAAVGVVGLVFITSIETRLNGITDVSAPTVETADDLVMNIWEATKVAEEIIADEDLSDVNELFKEFGEFNVEFALAYEELKKIVIDESLKDELARISDIHVVYEENTNKMFAAHVAELEEEEKADELLDSFDGIGGQLITMLDEFATENEAEMQQVENEGDALVESGNASAEQLNELLGSLFEEDYPVVEAALKLQRVIIEMQDTAGEYMAVEDSSELEGVQAEFRALVSSADEFIEVLTRLAETDEDREDAARLTETFRKWVETANQEEQLFDTHRDMLAAEQLADDLTEALETNADELADVLDVVVEKADALNDSADEEAAQVVAQAILFIVSGVGLATVVAIALVLITAKTITSQLTKMSTAMNDLSDGKLDVEVPSLGRNDEIGDMATSVQVFKENAQEVQKLQAEQAEAEERAEREKRKALEALANSFEDTVLGIVDGVSDSAKTMQDSSGKMAHAASQTLQSAKEVSTTSDEAADNVRNVASRTEQLTSSISKIASQIDHSTRIADQAVAEAHRSSEIVSGLEQAATAINNVVGLINDIAAQTNLLALNATIEAARAGDAGKGFAVVASEVKSLATETAKATDSITSQISSIQNESKEAVKAITSIQTVIGTINEISTSIAKSMEEQNAATGEISSSVEVTQGGSQKVSQEIASVITATTETEGAAREVLESTNQLSEQSETLKSEVAAFLQKVRTN